MCTPLGRELQFRGSEVCHRIANSTKNQRPKLDAFYIAFSMQFSATLAPFGSILAQFWATLAPFGPSWRHSSHLGVLLGHLSAILGHLGIVLGHLGATFGQLGAILSHLGAILNHLGAILRHLGVVLTLWAPFWDVLPPF